VASGPGTFVPMARRLCQFLFALALLYAAGVTAFAFLHYEKDARPDVLTICSEMHGWVRSKISSSTPATVDPAAVPARRDEVVVPPPAPPYGAEGKGSPVASDPRSIAIAKVRDEILPKAEAMAKVMGAPGTKVSDSKVDLRVVLVEARDLLGPIVDANPDDREAQRLYKRVSDLLIAADKR